MSTAEHPAQVLGQGVGWAVVVGLGLAFAAFMISLTWIQSRYTEHKATSVGEFSSASRSVRPGLIAAGIVSAWTWAATLLTSASMTYQYGVAGAYWYSAGAMLQILLCSIMACKLKSFAPFCSTYLEIIRIRYGKPVHAVFMAFAFVTNLLVSSQLVLGGAAVVHELTGLHKLVGIFLIPFSVAVYTVTGGLRATLIADYVHTVGLLVIILYFFFRVWTGHGLIGSLSHMVERLEHAARIKPVAGNAGGSYLTMRSQGGLLFGIINVCSNVAAVFCDQSYHQRSIASLPATASRGFLLGGSAWFPIPFVFGTTMGLAARALVHQVPTMYELTSKQIADGLPAPSVAVVLCGRGGAVAMLILLFLAVTSATSAQQIAVSSVFTFDVWKVYVHPSPRGQHMQMITHGAVLFWALIMSLFGLVLDYGGIGLGWVYTMMGIAVAPAACPIFASLVWKKTHPHACVVGMMLGCGLGMTTWLVTAGMLYGRITVETTGEQYPTVAGNLVSLLVSGIVVVGWSLVQPKNYTFADTRAFHAPKDLFAMRDPMGSTLSERVEEKCGAADSEVSKPVVALAPWEQDAGENNIEYVRAAGLDPVEMAAQGRRVTGIAVTCSILLVAVVPAVAICARTWTPAGLGVWVYLGLLWLGWSVLAVVIWPLWEARTEWVVIGRQRRCRRPAPHGEEGNSPRGGVAFFPLRMVGRRARQHDVAL